MDLIDIDQVLDNLELKEQAEELQRLALLQANAPPVPSAPHTAAVATATTTSISLTSTSSTASTSILNNGFGAGRSSSPIVSSAGGSVSNSNSKGFIGVSQVFNSLDDYRKNIESLTTSVLQKYDEECRPLKDANEVLEHKSLHKDNSKYTKIENESPNDSEESPLEECRRIEVLLDEEQARQDIHKFKEKVRKPFAGVGAEEDEEEDSLSDSLTTSSPSTFSSGPSLGGLGSTLDEPISPQHGIGEGAGEGEEEEQSALLLLEANEENQNDLDEVLPEVHLNQMKDPSSAMLVPTRPADEVEDGDDDHEGEENKPEVECLAEGLSSISITTPNGNSLLRCDASASSILDNVLEDLDSETTSTSLLSQMPEQNLQTDQILFSPIQGSHEMKKAQEQLSAETNYLLQKVKEQEEEQKSLPKPSFLEEQGHREIEGAEESSLKHPKYQQPITFCSTMDDISDTELDSMLQEMDIDDEQDKKDTLSQEGIQVKAVADTEQKAQPISSENTNEKEPETQPETFQELETQTETEVEVEVEVETEGDGDGEVEGEGEVEASLDNPNADSFSQASTVEFSEMKTIPVPIQQADNDDDDKNLNKNSNQLSSIASSFSSTSSSSMDEPANNQNQLDMGQQNQEENGNGKPQRPTTLDLPVLNPIAYSNAGQTPPDLEGTVPQLGENFQHPENAESLAALNIEASGFSDPHANLGKVPPIWVPDNMAAGCMQCGVKFTVIKRRHHCRACGKVLCSVCCSQKFKLDFLQEPESRVCVQCYLILNQRQHQQHQENPSLTQANHVPRPANPEEVLRPGQVIRSPNPNNPMEYCSTIPPHRQVSNIATPPPTVIVPVGVLKKSDGSYSSNSSNSNKQTRKRKSVMFSDGIAPGSELASSLEQQWGEAKQARRNLLQNNKQNNNAANKPPTPAKIETSKDITTMGLVASLFRGSIPPSAAAASISIAQQASNDLKSAPLPASPRKDSSTHSSDSNKNSSTNSNKRLPPGGCDKDGCFIPQSGDDKLPPIRINKSDDLSDFEYQEVANDFSLIEKLQQETLKFAIKTNFIVYVKIVNLKCCMNRTVINFTTCGMHYVGNDEIIILLEYEPPETKEQMQATHQIPKDIFTHLFEIYRDSEMGRPIAELSYTCPRQVNFLGSRDYGGFMFIRTTFQCLHEVVVPENPFLCGILIHRHEVPWAKVFPLRLMLRLGAQYRYYPCPHISIRNRESVYAEIAQTIINFLADFRHYSYTLPTIRGMYIHMEDRQTTVMIPRNRVDDVVKAINNATDHILALGGNFSKAADGHLVCMQNINDDRSEMYSYSTQAINIQGNPRKVTGTSFIVFNESLKSTSGLSGKCSIVEDGLMVQVLPAKMEEIRNCLRNRTDINIVCGPIDADEQNTEVVALRWVENDRDINTGVKSPIDEKPMDGISSMRVHASFNYSNAKYAIRLTDIFILKHEGWYNSSKPNLNTTSMDVTRIAEQIARSASMALVPFLDLLAASGSIKIGLRTTLHQDNVCYEAGSRGAKLPPLYMNALDNHLIPTLHNESTNIDEAIILELIFYILNV